MEGFSRFCVTRPDSDEGGMSPPPRVMRVALTTSCLAVKRGSLLQHDSTQLASSSPAKRSRFVASLDDSLVMTSQRDDPSSATPCGPRIVSRSFDLGSCFTSSLDSENNENQPSTSLPHHGTCVPTHDGALITATRCPSQSTLSFSDSSSPCNLDESPTPTVSHSRRPTIRCVKLTSDLSSSSLCSPTPLKFKVVKSNRQSRLNKPDVSLNALTSSPVNFTSPRDYPADMNACYNAVQASHDMHSHSPRETERSILESQAAVGRVEAQLDGSDEGQSSNLVGDLSRPCCLPWVPGKQADVNTVSPSTVADVIEGQYAKVIDDCVIVDCRYPYEFEGGHIKGAINIPHTAESTELFVVSTLQRLSSRLNVTKTTVVIFHCEFSVQRGPAMARHVRNTDRALNGEHYPQLHYPELYLMSGGYKAFFSSRSYLCTPCDYTPMDHPSYTIQLAHFRSRDSRRRGVASVTSEAKTVKSRWPIGGKLSF